jgi:small-conductance mechanosensitive channel
MGKRILSVVLGLICAFIIISLMEMLNSLFYTPPKGIDYKDPQAVRAMMEALPVSAFMLVLLGYILGTLAGAIVTTVIHRSGSLLPAFIVGILLMAANAANLYWLHHPTWFAVISMAVYLPMAYLGGLIGNRLVKKV